MIACASRSRVGLPTNEPPSDDSTHVGDLLERRKEGLKLRAVLHGHCVPVKSVKSVKGVKGVATSQGSRAACGSARSLRIPKGRLPPRREDLRVHVDDVRRAFGHDRRHVHEHAAPIRTEDGDRRAEAHPSMAGA